MFDILYIVIAALLVFCLIFGIYAQVNVHLTFNKFSKVEPHNSLDVNTATQKMLDHAGLDNIKIGKVSGNLTDNYNPKTKTISLSDSTRESGSVASFGIIAHEIGHAIQEKEGYGPYKVRSKMVPFVRFGSIMFIPLFIVGIILITLEVAFGLGKTLIWIATILYFLSSLFYIVTLPVEINASKRALALLIETGATDEDEIVMAKKVLKAAELTYVSALLTSLVYFLRFFLGVLPIFKRR